MLNRRVIAANITNLTDARYFAARGVDYLMFDVSQMSIDSIVEIKDWVEGPKHIVQLTEATLTLVEEAILKVTPAVITSNSSDVLRELQHYSAHVEVAPYIDQKITIGEVSYHSLQNLNQLKELEHEVGIIISGGEEEEVGMKNFDFLDELLDYLED